MKIKSIWKKFIILTSLVLLLISSECLAEKYVVTFEVKQTHFAIDPFVHLKDKENSLEMQIPVDKDFYDSVKPGTVIDNSFRTASFILSGSMGNWKITVKNKQLVK